MTTHYREVRNALNSFRPGAVVTNIDILDRIDTQRWSNVRACRLTIVGRYMRELAYEGKVTKLDGTRPGEPAQWRVEDKGDARPLRTPASRIGRPG